MKLKTQNHGTSVVAQWLRLYLPMQGVWVWSLIEEIKIPCFATVWPPKNGICLTVLYSSMSSKYLEVLKCEWLLV